MDQKRTSFIVDFNELKKEKQRKSDQALMDVYGLLFTYVEKQANLREKIRAKHLFSHKIDFPRNQAFDQSLQLHFEHWFVFDYVTVIGSRIFDLFVRDYKNELSKPMLDLCGHLMLMTLEPVKVLKETRERLTVERKLTGDIEEVESFLITAEVSKGDFAFMRIVPAGFSHKIIGPVFIIDDSDVKRVEAQVNDAIDSTGKEVENVRVKRFLKEYGVDFMRYAKHR
ncbi:hypothetical protein [Alteribacter keqinensis]|uniref:Uncharacterized protein n=1 Tax=Alteribacter keqinensis TaxID=2483800 RepID=A0A3M7TZS0_9BACI|nr:hypothetical protein [Alteribacter keqinensis]RNA70382.1 hypothetical protein EBO34_10785 [Alteribacter keqinensis]